MSTQRRHPVEPLGVSSFVKDYSISLLIVDYRRLRLESTGWKQTSCNCSWLYVRSILRRAEESSCLKHVYRADSILDDVSKERPTWPLSCYAPSKFEPTMVTGLDSSMEELRWKAVQAKASGAEGEYVSASAHIIDAIAGAKDSQYS